MDLNTEIESPMLLQIGFNKLFEQYKKQTEHSDEFIAARAKRILKIAEDHPILRDGFSDYSLLEDYKTQIEIILQDSFNPILTNNEIKNSIGTIP